MTARTNTLTIHLMGGLGNQLFQYAFGRRLALKNRADLLLDVSGYPVCSKVDPLKSQRALELTKFNIAGHVVQRDQAAGPLDRARRVWRKGWGRLAGVVDRFRPYYARREIVEPASRYFRFDRRVYDRDFQGALGVRGFWQTEKYFQAIASLLRRELTLRDPLSPVNQKFAAAIDAATSVAVHVRHGDNANSVAASLGVVARDYYQHSITALMQELTRPEFFVFSDDMEWARHLLSEILPAATMVHNGTAGAAEDLWLMSLCKHHVLANSTFGWWAAWLGRKPGQVVYAPRRYYQGLDRPNPDLYPAEWRLA